MDRNISKKRAANAARNFQSAGPCSPAVLFANRRWREAVAAVEQALASVPAPQPERPLREQLGELDAWLMHGLLAVAEVELGRLDLARPILEAAVAAADERWPAHPYAAPVRFALARALWQLGDDRARSTARELAGAARDTYRELGPGKEAERVAVEPWLHERRP